MDSLTLLLMNKFDALLEILANKRDTAKLQSINEKLLNFYCNQMHYNYKLDKNISKTLIKRIIPISDPNKKKYNIL